MHCSSPSFLRRSDLYPSCILPPSCWRSPASLNAISHTHRHAVAHAVTSIPRRPHHCTGRLCFCCPDVCYPAHAHRANVRVREYCPYLHSRPRRYVGVRPFVPRTPRLLKSVALARPVSRFKTPELVLHTNTLFGSRPYFVFRLVLLNEPTVVQFLLVTACAIVPPLRYSQRTRRLIAPHA
jgi:hypothetical protein